MQFPWVCSYRKSLANSIQNRIQGKRFGPQLLYMYILDIIEIGGKGCWKIYKSPQTSTETVNMEIKEKWERILDGDISIIEARRAFITKQTIPESVHIRYV